MEKINLNEYLASNEYPGRGIAVAMAPDGRQMFMIGMDEWNIRNIKRITGVDPEGKIFKMMSFAGSSRDVADPWYTGNFDDTYRDVVEGCEAFLE